MFASSAFTAAAAVMQHSVDPRPRPPVSSSAPKPGSRSETDLKLGPVSTPLLAMDLIPLWDIYRNFMVLP